MRFPLGKSAIDDGRRHAAHGFVEIFIAIGIVGCLGALSLSTQLTSRLAIQRATHRLNRVEGFYAGELSAWHSYRRSVDSLTSTGDQVVSLSNDFLGGIESTLSATPYSIQPGVSLNVSSTRALAPTKALIRRYVSGRLVHQEAVASHCGGISFGSKKIRVCLRALSAPSPIEVLVGWGSGWSGNSPPIPSAWKVAKMGANGNLVASYGINGVVSIPVNPALFVGGALALANAPANGQAGNAGDDGSVYVVTDGGGWKLKPDGTIDTAYGVDGYRGDSAWQDNLTRKLTAVWESNDQLLIIKDSYESPLRRVTSQAGAGTNFPELYQALQEGGRKGFVTRVLRKSDGRLLVSGYSEEPSTHTFRLLQLLPSGSIDPAFSFWGLPLSSFNLIYDCRLGANERWLMASVGSGNLTICSLSTTGLPDDGCQTFSIGAQSAFEPPLIVSDNRILIVESPMAPPFERKVYLRAFQLNGNADLTFGDNGTSIFKAEQLFTGSSMSTCAINQFQVLGSAKIADGSLLLALRGQNTTPFCRKGAFLKLDSAGKPDMTFGRDGLRVLEIDDHYMYSVGWAVISR